MVQAEYMKLSEISIRASMSPKTIKKHMKEITHYRATPQSPILIRWKDFEAWMDRRRRDAQEDPDVNVILHRISEAV